MTALLGALLLGGTHLNQLSSRLGWLTGVPFEPLSIPVTTNGTLRAGNFKFVEQQPDGPPRASATFKPGDTVRIVYEIEGFALDVDGNPDVAFESTLLNEAGARASVPRRSAAGAGRFACLPVPRKRSTSA